MRGESLTRHPALIPLAFAVLACLASGQAIAAEIPRYSAETEGGLAEDGPRGTTERVVVSPALASKLLNVPLDASVWIDGWPVAPGIRRSVLVARHDVYDPAARVVMVTEGGRLQDVPRSPLVFFFGTVDGEAGSILLSVDPRDSTFEGKSETEHGSYRLAVAEPGTHLLRPSNPSLGSICAATCDPTGDALAQSGAPAIPSAISTLHTASVAVDTDNEFMLKKFANNPQAAVDYLAQLFAAMNVMYERDLLIRLLQGVTFLRLSTTPDPYIQGPDVAGATVGRTNQLQLDEFRDYWVANYSGTTRAVVAMISGKQPDASTSGAAWVSALCTPTGNGSYSFNQVYTAPARPAADDAREVGHEIGHNFGTRHTHCNAPPADQCWTGEAMDCYNGPTSCPAAQTYSGIANVRGTVMSWCDRPRASDPTWSCPVSNVFHPVSVAMIQPVIVTAVGVCVFPLAAANTPPVVLSVSPNQGRTAGGTAVTITGTGFQAGATAFFGHPPTATPLTAVNVANATTITATTAAHAAGVVEAVVANPDQQSFSLFGAFTYRPDPTVTAISPASGSHLGGTPVTITGTGFVAPATVTLGGVAATGVTVASPTSITATTGAHLPGAVDAAFSSTGGLQGTLASGFTYLAPTVTSISPNGGSAAGGTAVTINGSGFSSPATVTLGGAAATSVTVLSPGSLTATTGPHASGIVNVSVGLPLALNATLPGSFFYTPVMVPVAFFTLPPCRLVDTRDPVGPRGGPALVASSPRVFALNGACGVPAGAKAISVNLTVVQPTNPGFLTLYPSDGLPPPTSSVNFSPNQVRANNAVLLLATNGTSQVTVLNGSAGTTHFILDVNGYFQ